MAFNIAVGQVETLSLIETAADGSDLSPQIAFDSPPTWQVDNAAVVTMAVAADGASATFTGIGVGACNITGQAMVQGKTFQFSDQGAVTTAVAGIRVAEALTTP